MTVAATAKRRRRQAKQSRRYRVRGETMPTRGKKKDLREGKRK